MKHTIERIVALIPNWLGDVAMCTPALRSLHTRFPGATLTVAGRGGPCALLEGLPWLGSSVTLPPRPGLAALWQAGTALRTQRFDLAVVFPHSFRAGLLAWLSRAPVRVGYARDGRSLLLTNRIPPFRADGRIQPVYMAKEYQSLVTHLGCESDGKGLELRADPGALAAVATHFDGRRPRIGFAPGGAFGSSKRWPAGHFAAVADALLDTTGGQGIILTGPGEEALRESIQQTAHKPLSICDGGQPTIDSLKATIAQLDLLVCNDSGPRHVAVAFGIPTVCIMGSTSPRYSAGPYERGRVVRVDVDCGPCQQSECDKDFRCMLNITPEMVIAAALEVLP